LRLVSQNPLCPVCQRMTHRVHRRVLDMIVNLFVPILRFRCSAMDCDWEGRLRRRTIERETRRE
jgi:hypothetical protein